MERRVEKKEGKDVTWRNLKSVVCSGAHTRSTKVIDSYYLNKAGWQARLEATLSEDGRIQSTMANGRLSLCRLGRWGFKRF